MIRMPTELVDFNPNLLNEVNVYFHISLFFKLICPSNVISMRMEELIHSVCPVSRVVACIDWSLHSARRNCDVRFMASPIRKMRWL